MPISVDPKILREIALRNIAQRENAEKVKKEEHDQEILQKARHIINSIPKNLAKTASNITEITPGAVLTVKVLIVREQMTSADSTQGTLEESDAEILETVAKLISTEPISGLDSLEIETEIEYFSFHSNDLTSDEESKPGPCVCYYLVAMVPLAE